MNDIILSIISLFSGGFLTAAGMLSINRKKGKEEVKSSKLDNTDKLLDLYEEKIIKPLQVQIAELKKENESTRKAISEIGNCVNRVECPVLRKLLSDSEADPQNHEFRESDKQS